MASVDRRALARRNNRQPPAFQLPKLGEILLMSRNPLKLFSPGCDASAESSCQSALIRNERRERELDRISGTAMPKTTAVQFGAFVKFLSQAIQDDAAWLDDFADDTVQIDADLHDVLLNYQQLRQRRAA